MLRNRKILEPKDVQQLAFWPAFMDARQRFNDKHRVVLEFNMTGDLLRPRDMNNDPRSFFDTASFGRRSLKEEWHHDAGNRQQDAACCSLFTAFKHVGFRSSLQKGIDPWRRVFLPVEVLLLCDRGALPMSLPPRLPG